MQTLDRRIETGAEFQQVADGIRNDPGYKDPVAWGLGVARVSTNEEAGSPILDVKFFSVNGQGENLDAAAVVAAATRSFERVDERGILRNPKEVKGALENAFTPFTGDGRRHPNVIAAQRIFEATSRRPERYATLPVISLIHDFESNPTNTVDAWFRLILLSRLKRSPNTVGVDGLFGHMTNVAWTSDGPMLPEDVDEARAILALNDEDLIVRGVDRFPHMLDYVSLPGGVRVADATRVRLGAHLAPGTTVMHEGFVNFNAGTLGKSMVEGRISAGVVVGEGSDIGGGASIQGTLSGGGKQKISIGQRTLLEANCGTGISLGNDCRVEAGTYVKATTPVTLPDGSVVKAIAISGGDNMLLRRNAGSGVVEMVPNKGGEWGGLNKMLHG